MVDASWPVEFGGGPIGPERRHRAVLRYLGQEGTGGSKQVERGFEPRSIQAFEQIEQLAFAATAIHGRGATKDTDTVHAVGFR